MAWDEEMHCDFDLNNDGSVSALMLWYKTDKYQGCILQESRRRLQDF